MNYIHNLLETNSKQYILKPSFQIRTNFLLTMYHYQVLKKNQLAKYDWKSQLHAVLNNTNSWR